MPNTQFKEGIFLGLDLGSISLNTVVIDAEENVLENHYDYCHGKPFLVLRDRLSDILSRYEPGQILQIATTGSGGKLAAELIGGQFVNEIIAQSRSVSKYYPGARTIIEMGGEDSKLIFMENGREKGHSSLSDFSMNSICAAGTGSFLDQQARRIGVSIVGEFGDLALKSERPPHIAGRKRIRCWSGLIFTTSKSTLSFIESDGPSDSPSRFRNSMTPFLPVMIVCPSALIATGVMLYSPGRRPMSSPLPSHKRTTILFLSKEVGTDNRLLVPAAEQPGRYNVFS